MFYEISVPQILGTDVYLSLFSETYSLEMMQSDTESYISVLKEFEQKFSRFIEGNYLDQINNKSSFKGDPEFNEIIKIAIDLYNKTDKIFNPAVLPILIKSGYSISKYEGYHKDDTPQHQYADNYEIDFSKLKINNGIITKPLNLRLDLGGLGKGFVADKLANIIKQKYSDYCIDLGGDLYLGGVDKIKKYDYWAIEIESPFGAEITNNIETPTLLVSNIAVATSGVNKRKWNLNGQIKNHIIDPRNMKSIDNDILCTTVIWSKTVEADVFAKTILILGVDNGLAFANNNHIPAVIISKSKVVYYSNYADEYIYK